MTVLNLVLGGTIFTEGGHYSPVNNVLGGQYSLVNNVGGGRGGTLFIGEYCPPRTLYTMTPARMHSVALKLVKTNDNVKTV